MNLATVDAQGVIISQPLVLLYYYGNAFGVVNHIGVGSNVVCSTLIGSARASTRGMDNGNVPRLNLNHASNLLLVKSKYMYNGRFDT